MVRRKKEWENRGRKVETITKQRHPLLLFLTHAPRGVLNTNSVLESTQLAVFDERCLAAAHEERVRCGSQPVESRLFLLAPQEQRNILWTIPEFLTRSDLRGSRRSLTDLPKAVVRACGERSASLSITTDFTIVA